MNREQFIAILDRSLQKLESDERRDILQDFEEHFDVGTEKGRTEEEIAASLGSPKQIAKELLAETYLKKAEAAASLGNMLRAVWAAVGLGFFNLVIVLGPFIGLICLALSGWIVAVSFLASPLLVLLNLAIYPDSLQIFDIFVSMALTGLGLLLSVGMTYASRIVFKGFVKYLRYDAKLVKGGIKHD